MKTFLTIFFVTLGVIFFGLILAGAYFYITDPFNLKPLLFGEVPSVPAPTVAPDDIADTSTTNDQVLANEPEATLSPEQEAVLRTVGIDPATIPTEITPDQEACFIEILGAARVADIQAGAAPTPNEVFRARGCLE